MSKRKVLYFYAPWDRYFVSKKVKMLEECKRVGLNVEFVDVETTKGVEKSIEYKVRNVPTAVILNNRGKVEAVEKGNYIHEIIAKYS